MALHVPRQNPKVCVSCCWLYKIRTQKGNFTSWPDSHQVMKWRVQRYVDFTNQHFWRQQELLEYVVCTHTCSSSRHSNWASSRKLECLYFNWWGFLSKQRVTDDNNSLSPHPCWPLQPCEMSEERLTKCGCLYMFLTGQTSAAPKWNAPINSINPVVSCCQEAFLLFPIVSEPHFTIFCRSRDDFFIQRKTVMLTPCGPPKKCWIMNNFHLNEHIQDRSTDFFVWVSRFASKQPNKFLLKSPPVACNLKCSNWLFSDWDSSWRHRKMSHNESRNDLWILKSPVESHTTDSLLLQSPSQQDLWVTQESW